MTISALSIVLRINKKAWNGICIFIEASPNAQVENTAALTPYRISVSIAGVDMRRA